MSSCNISLTVPVTNVDDPVYRFMMKKKLEGKPFHVYMTAGSNKFLRIYYGKVKEFYAATNINE
jgi:transposase